MSILSKLLGKRTFSEERERAEQLLAAGELGPAKLAFERALERARGADEPVVEALRLRIIECRDGIGRERIAEGDRLRNEGAIELAHAEYESAMEAAASSDLIDIARKRIDELEHASARAEAIAPSEDLDADARYLVLSGTWEDEQTDEYESYGEPFRLALLALHEGKLTDAVPVIESALTQARDPRYVYFELGRAKLMLGETEAGTTALRTFLSRIGVDEGGETRLVAHVELARVAEEAGDFEGAVAEYERAIEALADDPRPYLGLGQFLRLHDQPSEAVEVLESGLAVMDEMRPDWRVLQELGLAHAAASDDEKAVDRLEQVIRLMSSRQHFDFPPESAVALAKLYEKQGRPERAADLYRGLTQGSDVANHGTYYREAARLLRGLGLLPEARRLLQRARAVLDESSEAHAAVIHELADLDST